MIPPHLKEVEQMHGQPGSPIGCCHLIQDRQNSSFAGSVGVARVRIRTELRAPELSEGLPVTGQHVFIIGSHMLKKDTMGGK